MNKFFFAKGGIISSFSYLIHNFFTGLWFHLLLFFCLFLFFVCLFHGTSTIWSCLLPNPFYTYKQFYEVHTISFQTFFVWALLLIVHTWNASPRQSNLLRLQCTCTVPTTSGRPQGSPLVWACQCPSPQHLSSPQLSHNDSLWVSEKKQKS